MGKKLKSKLALKGKKADMLSRKQKQILTQDLLEHPIRFRIVEWLSGENEPHTQREIGKALSLSNASVHYHLNLLEEIGIVVLKGTRPGPNSITEKLYTAVQLRGNSEYNPPYYLQLTFSRIQELYREAGELIPADWETHRFLAGWFKVQATPTELRKLKRSLMKTIEVFQKTHKKTGKNTKMAAITLGILPTEGAGLPGCMDCFDMIS